MQPGRLEKLAQHSPNIFTETLERTIGHPQPSNWLLQYYSFTWKPEMFFELSILVTTILSKWSATMEKIGREWESPLGMASSALLLVWLNDRGLWWPCCVVHQQSCRSKIKLKVVWTSSLKWPPTVCPSGFNKGHASFDPHMPSMAKSMMFHEETLCSHADMSHFKMFKKT